MLGIAVSIGLLLLWILMLYGVKRKLAIILLGIAVGILGVFSLSGFVEFNWFTITRIPLTEWQSKAVVAPVVEELSKLFFIFLIARLERRAHILSNIKLFGASLGLGFAFIENFGVIAYPLNALLRGLIAWPLHIGTATLLAYGGGHLLKSVSKRNLALTLAALMAAMLIHSFFNQTVLIVGFH